MLAGSPLGRDEETASPVLTMLGSEIQRAAAMGMEVIELLVDVGLEDVIHHKIVYVNNRNVSGRENEILLLGPGALEREFRNMVMDYRRATFYIDDPKPHLSTLGAIWAMEGHPPQNQKVLVVGSGEGTLVILADKLGANEVVGLDAKDFIIKLAKENAALNQTKNTTSFSIQDFTSPVDGGNFDMIVTNLPCGYTYKIAPLLRLYSSVSIFIWSGGYVHGKGREKMVEESEEYLPEILSLGFRFMKKLIISEKEKDGGVIIKWVTYILERENKGSDPNLRRRGDDLNLITSASPVGKNLSATSSPAMTFAETTPITPTSDVQKHDVRNHAAASPIKSVHSLLSAVHRLYAIRYTLTVNNLAVSPAGLDPGFRRVLNYNQPGDLRVFAGKESYESFDIIKNYYKALKDALSTQEIKPYIKFWGEANNGLKGNISNGDWQVVEVNRDYIPVSNNGTALFTFGIIYPDEFSFLERENGVKCPRIYIGIYFNSRYLNRNNWTGYIVINLVGESYRFIRAHMNSWGYGTRKNRGVRSGYSERTFFANSPAVPSLFVYTIFPFTTKIKPPAYLSITSSKWFLNQPSLSTAFVIPNPFFIYFPPPTYKYKPTVERSQVFNFPLPEKAGKENSPPASPIGKDVSPQSSKMGAVPILMPETAASGQAVMGGRLYIYARGNVSPDFLR